MKRKSCIVLYMLLMSVLVCTMTFCATIYQNDVVDSATDKNIGKRQYEPYDRSKIGPVVDDTNIKPTAETTIDPNILYTTRKNWEKERKNNPTIIIPNEYVTPSEATHEYSVNQKYTYIRHRSGMANITGAYDWEEYTDDHNESQTRLLIYHSDDEKGLPHYAYSGFYKIGDDVYCFDKNGNLIKGIAKDEYDIIYEFDSESGKLIKQYKDE